MNLRLHGFASPGSKVPIRLPTACILVSLLVAAGCQDLAPSPTPTTDSAATISTDEILNRCVDAFRRANTLTARGTLRDFRTEDRKILPIAWDFARPGHCRVEIGTSAAIVNGDDWWNYDTASGQYKKRKAFTRTPMETASYLVSRGISFLLPAVFERGEAAFGKSRTKGYAEWRLIGVAWLHERPCYVVAKAGTGREAKTTLRVWVDQDSYLVRGWDVVQPDNVGREQTVVACTYHEIDANAAISAGRFDLTPPSPQPTSRPTTQRERAQFP